MSAIHSPGHRFEICSDSPHPWSGRQSAGALATRAGESPEAACAAALTHLNRAAEINPFSPDPLLDTAKTLHELARWRLQQGNDVVEILAQAREVLQRVLELNPNQAEAHALLAVFATIEAAAATDSVRVGELRTQARQSLQTALALNPVLSHEYGWLATDSR